MGTFSVVGIFVSWDLNKMIICFFMLNKMLTNEFIYNLHPKWNFKQEKTTIICTSTEYVQEFPIKPSIYIYSVYQLGYGNYNNSQTTWKLSKPKYQTQTTLEQIK